jgi:hypothetical protein
MSINLSKIVNKTTKQVWIAVIPSQIQTVLSKYGITATTTCSEMDG